MAQNGFSVQASLTCPLKLLFAIRSLARLGAVCQTRPIQAIQIFVIQLK